MLGLLTRLLEPLLSLVAPGTGRRRRQVRRRSLLIAPQGIHLPPPPYPHPTHCLGPTA